MSLPTYAEYAPTGFDTPGAFLENRADWIVGPCGINRDSQPLEVSNWEAQLASLPDESDLEEEDWTWEKPEFKHWACGWFGIVIAKPGTEAARILEELSERLEDYPVLDECDLSEREHNDAMESWDTWGVDDFRRELVTQFGLSENTRYRLDDIDASELWEFHHTNAPNSYETHGDGPHFDFRYLEHGDTPTREHLAEFLNRTRPKPHGPYPLPTETQLHFALHA